MKNQISLIFSALCIVLSGISIEYLNGQTIPAKKPNPESFINQHFEIVTVKSGIQFSEVTDYKGKVIPLLLDIYEAEGDLTEGRPVILWIHGGGFRTANDRTQSYVVRYCNDFAKRGFVCVSIDYRVRESKDMPTREHEFPALQDAARDANIALDWIRKNGKEYGINPQLIFIAGGSAGGRTTATVSQFKGPDTKARYSPENKYKSSPWNKTGLIAAACLWGGPEKEFRAWVYPYLNENGLPTVLIHGEADSTINVQNSIDFYNAMKNAGIRTELHIIPGAPHTPSNKNTDPVIEDWIARFFVREWQSIPDRE